MQDTLGVRHGEVRAGSMSWMGQRERRKAVRDKDEIVRKQTGVARATGCKVTGHIVGGHGRAREGPEHPDCPQSRLLMRLGATVPAPLELRG